MIDPLPTSFRKASYDLFLSYSALILRYITSINAFIRTAIFRSIRREEAIFMSYTQLDGSSISHCIYLRITFYSYI